MLECAAFLDLLLLIDHGYASPPPSSSIRPDPDQLSPAARIVSGIGALLVGRGVSVIRRWLGSTRPGCLAVTEKTTPAMAAETIAEPPSSRQVLPRRRHPPMEERLSLIIRINGVDELDHAEQCRTKTELHREGEEEAVEEAIDRQAGRQAGNKQIGRQAGRQRNRECVIPIARWRLSNLGLVWQGMPRISPPFFRIWGGGRQEQDVDEDHEVQQGDRDDASHEQGEVRKPKFASCFASVPLMSRAFHRGRGREEASFPTCCHVQPPTAARTTSEWR